MSVPDGPAELGTAPLSVLDDGQIRLILVGGKGGVGKTTLAAALSLRLAEKFPWRRFLTVSPGPSHALGRILDCRLDSVPRPIWRKANLYAAELNAQGLFSEFKSRYGRALRMILRRGTYLDDDDISGFLNLSFPGLDELMAVLEIIKLLDDGRYDTVIVDTAPTGHTLRLLALPALSQTWVSMLDRMLAKHRFISRAYTRRYRKDEADEFIETLNGEISRLAAVLRNPASCQFVPVALLEPVVLAETERLLEGLAAHEIRPKALVLNQVMLPPGECALCQFAYTAQQDCFRSLASRHPELEFASFPGSPEEVRGEQSLRALTADEKGVRQVCPRATGADENSTRFACGAGRVGPVAGRPTPVPEPGPDLRFLLFCGKGGTGKTTLSCAYALQLSQRYPEKNILLFSTDPAHSLSDCLAQKIGPAEQRVAGRTNLFAIEINPDVLFQQWKQSYSREIEGIFERFSQRAGVDVLYDRQVLTGLLDLTPPGLDELMSLSQLADLTERNRYDLYVLDTAPGGHTMRFLELFTLVQEWLATFFELLLKYRHVARLPKASETLAEMSERIRDIRRLFTDAARCQAVLVTTPAKTALEETEALLAALERTGIGRRTLLVNQLIVHPDGCPRCEALAGEHRRQLQRYQQAFPDLEITPLPRRPSPLRGVRALAEFIRLVPPADRREADLATAAGEEMAIRRVS